MFYLPPPFRKFIYRPSYIHKLSYSRYDGSPHMTISWIVDAWHSCRTRPNRRRINVTYRSFVSLQVCSFSVTFSEQPSVCVSIVYLKMGTGAIILQVRTFPWITGSGRVGKNKEKNMFDRTKNIKCIVDDFICTHCSPIADFRSIHVHMIMRPHTHAPHIFFSVWKRPP